MCFKEATYTEIEMQNPHHEAAAAVASKTIYSTASAANLHGVSVEENRDTYSSVIDTKQAPTYFTLGHPTETLSPTADGGVQDPGNDSTPLYHTVNQHWAQPATLQKECAIVAYIPAAYPEETILCVEFYMFKKPQTTPPKKKKFCLFCLLWKNSE